MHGRLKNLVEKHFFALLIIGLALILRIILLWNSSIWADEAYAIREMASTSFSEIIATLKEDPGSPAYYFLLRIWVLLFGDSEMAAASLSTLLSASTPLFTYLFARRIFHHQTPALIACALIGFNEASLTHSANVRYYAMLELLTLLSAGFFWEMIHSKKGFFPYAVISALALYTHTYFFFVLAGQFFVVLFLFPRRFFRFFGALLVIFLLFSPWLTVQVHQALLQTAGKIGAPYPELSEYGGIGQAFFKSISNKTFGWKYGHPAALFIVAILLVGGPFLAYGRRGWKPYAAHALTLIVMIGIPLLISLWKPIFLLGRYDIIAAPYVALSFGYLLARIPFPYTSVLIIVMLALGGILRTGWFVEERMDEDRAVIQEISEFSTSDDAYIFMGLSRFAANYYLDQYAVPTGQRYVFPEELEDQAAFIQPGRYKDKEETLREEGIKLIEELKKSDADRAFLFYADYPHFDVLEELMNQNFTREWTREIRPHPWGPLYQYVVLFKIK